MLDDLGVAAALRVEQAQDDEIDKSLSLLLARYEAVTADKQKMSYLRFLLKHYSASETPWRDCYRDNAKRFSPMGAKKVCSVVKDTLRQSVGWRGHPERDHGSPGVDIAYADAPGSKQWHGHAGLKLSDVPDEIWALLEDLTAQCDPCRVLLGLDPAPEPSATFLSDYMATA